MDNTATTYLGKAAGYLASLIGIVTAGMLLLSGGLIDSLLWASLLVVISLIAAYAIRAERLLLIWSIAIISGALSLIAFMPILVLAGPVLYALAAVLLTVNDYIGRPILRSTR